MPKPPTRRGRKTSRRAVRPTRRPPLLLKDFPRLDVLIPADVDTVHESWNDFVAEIPSPSEALLVLWDWTTLESRAWTLQRPKWLKDGAQVLVLKYMILSRFSHNELRVVFVNDEDHEVVREYLERSFALLRAHWAPVY